MKPRAAKGVVTIAIPAIWIPVATIMHKIFAQFDSLNATSEKSLALDIPSFVSGKLYLLFAGFLQILKLAKPATTKMLITEFIIE